MKPKKAVKELEKQLRKDPDNLVLRLRLAAALREWGKTDQAVSLYRSVAVQYHSEGRLAQAIAVCKSVLEIDPGQRETLGLLGELEMMTRADGLGGPVPSPPGPPPPGMPPSAPPVSPRSIAPAVRVLDAPPQSALPGPPAADEFDRRSGLTPVESDLEVPSLAGNQPIVRASRDTPPSPVRVPAPVAEAVQQQQPKRKSDQGLTDSRPPGVPARKSGRQRAAPAPRHSDTQRAPKPRFTSPFGSQSRPLLTPTPLPPPMPSHEADEDSIITSPTHRVTPPEPMFPPPLRTPTGEIPRLRDVGPEELDHDDIDDDAMTTVAPESGWRPPTRKPAASGVRRMPPRDTMPNPPDLEPPPLAEPEPVADEPGPRPGGVFDEATRFGDSLAEVGEAARRPTADLAERKQVTRRASEPPPPAAPPAPAPRKPPAVKRRPASPARKPVAPSVRQARKRPARALKSTLPPPGKPEPRAPVDDGRQTDPMLSARRAAAPRPMEDVDDITDIREVSLSNARVRGDSMGEVTDPERTRPEANLPSLPPRPRPRMEDIDIVDDDHGVDDYDDATVVALDGGPFGGGFGADFDEALEGLAPDGSAIDTPLTVFSELPGEALTELVRRMSLRSYRPGEIVLREGDPGNACYVIASGSVRVLKRDPKSDGADLLEVARLGNGAIFGEFALLADRRRHATVQAIEPCELYEIPRRLLRELAASFADVGPALERFYRERLLSNLMSTAPFFAPLAEDERGQLLARFRPMHVDSGQQVIAEGEKAGGLYLIVLGSVEITKQVSPVRSVLLTTLGEGAYFGELSLMRGSPARASVTAAGPTELAVLPPDAFYEIVAQNPLLWEEIRQEAHRRELMLQQIVTGETGVV